MCVYVWVHVPYVWSELSLQEWGLYYYHVSPHSWSQVTRLGGKHLCLLYHLAALGNTFNL